MKYHKYHVRKERIHKKRKLHQRILCIAIVMLMIISLQPQNMLLANTPEPVEAEQNTEVPVGDEMNQSDALKPVAETKEVPQENGSGAEEKEETPEAADALPVEPRDYSALTEAVQLRISGVSFHENDKAKDNLQQIKTVDGRLDLSGFHVGEIIDPKMEFSLTVPSVIKETSIHKGDYLQFDLPAALFKNIDTKAAVYTLQEDGSSQNTGEKIAEVVVDKNNQAIVTFLKDITEEEYSSLQATFTLPMTIDEIAVSSSNLIDMLLQKSEKEPLNVQILLPIVQKEEPADQIKEPVKEEQPENEKAKEESKQEDFISPVEEQKQHQQPVEVTQKNKKSLENRMQKFSTKTITDMFQLLANNPYRQIFTTGLPDGFESVKISILNKADGYTKSTSDKSVGFKFDVVLSDDFLLDELERITSVIPDAPIYTGNDKKYEEEMLKFLAEEETKKELIPLEYTFDLADNFNNYSSKSHTDLMDEHNEKIGEYYIEKGIVHVVFESEMYFYSGVSAGFSFEAALDDDADLSDQPKDVEFNKGNLVLKETGSSSGGDQPADAPKYSIDKDGPLSVDSPQITYTIDLKSKNDTDKLNGKWLIDMIPSGMQVKSLFKVNGSIETLINPDEYKIADVGDKKELRYQMKDSDNRKELAFKLVLELDADVYQM